MSNQPRTCFRKPINRQIIPSSFTYCSLAIGLIGIASFAFAQRGSAVSTASQSAQEVLKAAVSVVATSPGRVRIEIESPVATDVWSFANVYAGVIGLGDRIEKVVAVSTSGEEVSVRRLAAGEFRTAQRVSRLIYEVRLPEPARSADKSHVSWLNNSEGLLMMADLLPSTTRAASIDVKTPDGWSVSSVAQKSNQTFVSQDASNLIFLLGRNVRSKLAKLESSDWHFSFTERWVVPEKDVKHAVEKIIREYTKLTRFKIQRPTAVYLIGDTLKGPEQFTAEARGDTVVLLMGQRGERRNVLARLKVILTHELFHLWVPNSLALSGDYDWFFEGFTLYQALRTTQKLGLVDFAEFLKTIGRVYDSYLLAPDGDKLSLLDLSARRWTSANSLVYHRGMLVAFLYDLQLRFRSGGRQTIADVYAQLFSSSHQTTSAAANEVIIDILERPEEMGQFTARHVKGSEPLDLGSLLSPYGLELRRENFKTELSVSPTLNDDQRKLLKSLGYKK